MMSPASHCGGDLWAKAKGALSSPKGEKRRSQINETPGRTREPMVRLCDSLCHGERGELGSTLRSCGCAMAITAQGWVLDKATQ